MGITARRGEAAVTAMSRRGSRADDSARASAGIQSNIEGASDKVPAGRRTRTSEISGENTAVSNKAALHPLSGIEKEIRHRRESIAVRRGYLSLLENVLVLALIVVIAFTRIFMVTVASGTDMYPMVLDGDIVFGYRLDRDFIKNDVVICAFDVSEAIARTEETEETESETEKVTEVDSGVVAGGGNGAAQSIETDGSETTLSAAAPSEASSSSETSAEGSSEAAAGARAARYIRPGKRTVIGRVVAREGDTVNITDGGKLYVNGTEQTGEIAFPTNPGKQTYPYTVPEGCVFLLGDYRTQTLDSRDFGPVKVSDIKAKVVSIMRRRGI